MADSLFAKGDVSEFFDHSLRALGKEVRAGGMDDLILKAPETAVEQLCGKHALKPVKIDWEEAVLWQTGQDDVLEINLRVPFAGTPSLLQYRPSHHGDMAVAGTANEIYISTVIAGLPDVTDFTREFKRWRDGLEFQLKGVNEDAEKFNRNLPATVEDMVKSRTEWVRSAVDAMAGIKRSIING